MTEATEKKQKADRVPSTIAFPYSDMSDAIAVAEGIIRGGGLPLSRDQLAAVMGLSPNGGGFAKTVATARTFGIIEPTAGKYQLSEIGYEIVDPGRQQEAKIKAFLNVELYKRVYDEFRGKLLPPKPHGLENAFVAFGVSPKNAKQARLAFEKSARMAGFFPSAAEDRLVMPFGVSSDAPPVNVALEPVGLDVATTTDSPSAATSAPKGIHKSILGMLDELPAPKTEWSKMEQADWLEAVATLFQVIYKSEDKGQISVSYSVEP